MVRLFCFFFWGGFKGFVLWETYVTSAIRATTDIASYMANSIIGTMTKARHTTEEREIYHTIQINQRKIK
jgi:hypothetical protein